jgi:hypothetical protein
MYFCIRDDDTSFFTTPDELEEAYGEITERGPVSLAIVPFHRSGTSKGVPRRFRGDWSIHPLHENRSLVSYLKQQISRGRFEAMLHGYYHDEMHGEPEFADGDDLARRVTEGRKYLEDLLATSIRVFVPPRNCIGRRGLEAIAQEGLHLGGSAGLRRGWRLGSYRTWLNWVRLRRWKRNGGAGIPWILDLGDHREIPGNPVTPSSSSELNEAVFQKAQKVGGSFCLATHYWELRAPSCLPGEPTVGAQLRRLVHLAVSNPQVCWRSVGDVVSELGRVI